MTGLRDRLMTDRSSWNARHLDLYRQEVVDGHHDQQCEQRVRSSLCHCSKRKRVAEGKTELPRAHFPMPECEGCGNELDHDGDKLYCSTCKVAWGRNPGDGDAAEYFTDDYGTEPLGSETFGERLLVVIDADETPWTYTCPGTYQDGGDLGSVCDTCGDMSNSKPGLPCGRTEDEVND